jgi:hypothetical protein
MSNYQDDAVGDNAQGTHDVMIVSAVALWAMLIGFMPVVAFRLLGV